MKKNIKKIILSVLVLASFLLIAYHIKNEYWDQNEIAKMYAEDIKLEDNSLDPLDFVSVQDIEAGRADKVQPLSKESYNKYRDDMKRAVAKGRLYIPSVDTDLGIYLGLHNANLNKGACEQLPRSQQKMGEKGNYILVTHKMRARNVLFNRLPDMSEGDLIYVSDYSKIYVYKADIVRGVHASENGWINEEPTDEKLITLYTCLNTWLGIDDRTIVRGHLVDEMSVNNIKEGYNSLKEYVKNFKLSDE